MLYLIGVFLVLVCGWLVADCVDHVMEARYYRTKIAECEAAIASNRAQAAEIEARLRAIVDCPVCSKLLAASPPELRARAYAVLGEVPPC